MRHSAAKGRQSDFGVADGNSPVGDILRGKRIMTRSGTRKRNGDKPQMTKRSVGGLTALSRCPSGRSREVELIGQIYRRLMLLQRRKAAHAALVSHERETGGSDPILPDFWDDEDDSSLQHRSSSPSTHIHNDYPTQVHLPSFGQAVTPPHNLFITPPRPVRRPSGIRPARDKGEQGLTQAGIEAAEAAEAELAEQIEREMALNMQMGGREVDMDMDEQRSVGGPDTSDMDFGDIDWDEVDRMEQAAMSQHAQGHQAGQGMDVDMD